MTKSTSPAHTGTVSNATATFVGTEKAAAKIAALRSLPGVVEESERVYAQMVEDDRLYAESLAAIRKAANLTQVELGEHMGVPQSVISRLEKQSDMLLSTLADYLAAAGERPRVVVTVNGRDVEYDLTPHRQ
jgi:hypothetical protein